MITTHLPRLFAACAALPDVPDADRPLPPIALRDADAPTPLRAAEQDPPQAGVARAAVARRSAARAARRPRSRRSASASRCSTRSASCRRIAQPRRPAPPDAVHRQADARGRRRAVARRPSPSCQLGRAQDSLALHEAERWRAELIADDEATTRCAAEHAGSRPAAAAQRSSATRARTPRARPSSAAAAPTASCSSSSASTQADELTQTLARRTRARPRAHRPRLGQRPRVERRLRGQGHPGAAATGCARALRNPIDWETRLIPDEQALISGDAARAGRRARAATSC